MFFQKGGDDAKDLVDGLPRTTPFRSLDDWIARGHGKDASIKTREARKSGAFEGQRFTAIVKNAAGGSVRCSVTRSRSTTANSSWSANCSAITSRS